MVKQYVKTGDVLCYRNAENLGPDRNILNCLKASSGKYVHLMSDDDILLDGGIEKIIQLIQNEAQT